MRHTHCIMSPAPPICGHPGLQFSGEFCQDTWTPNFQGSVLAYVTPWSALLPAASLNSSLGGKDKLQGLLSMVTCLIAHSCAICGHAWLQEC